MNGNLYVYTVFPPNLGIRVRAQINKIISRRKMNITWKYRYLRNVIKT